MNYSISKSKIELYKLRKPNTSDSWADITIDPNQNGGRIQIASDFGSWQYYWGGAGESFKKFLIGLNIEYMASKFGCSRHFDFFKTIEFWKKEVIRYRRDLTLEAKEAREMFDEIKNFESEGPFTSSEFEYRARNEAETWMRFNDWMPETIHIISPQFKKFWDTAWQAFVEELKQELEINKQA